MNVLTLFRVIVFLISIASFICLVIGFVRHRDRWNSKTRDYWYALTMWSLVGASVTYEGIQKDTPMHYSTVFVIAAAVVSLIGFRRKGKWGSDD